MQKTNSNKTHKKKSETMVEEDNKPSAEAAVVENQNENDGGNDDNKALATVNGTKESNRAVVASEAEETDDEDVPVDVIEDDEGWCTLFCFLMVWSDRVADSHRLDLLDDYPPDVEVCKCVKRVAGELGAD